MTGFFGKYGVVILVILIIRIVLSLLVGFYANKRGRSFGLFFFLSLLLSSVIGFIILAISLSVNKTPNAPASDFKNSNADEIMKYKNLLDEGAITKEEYEEKKKQLLGL